MLFGVHAFWWHPIVVFIAWLRCYRKLPSWPELVAIALHDSYWGMPNIDGPEGKMHPARGAHYAGKLAGRRAMLLVLGHSRSFAGLFGFPLSALCAPDKLSILVEPRWFYLLRAKLSGEAEEFRDRAVQSGEIKPGASVEEWYLTYTNHVRKSFL